MSKYALAQEMPVEDQKELEKYGQFLSRLLWNRGIKTEKEAEIFLKPNYDSLFDPFLLKDMDKAVERILRAIDAKEHVVVFSDYDSDGIPGAALMKDFFEKIGFANYEIYLPHREDEGFGLNAEALKEFSARKTKLVITVDCGIADLDEAKLCAELGMDLIVTDHHEPKEELPIAFAVIDPKRSDCEYPFKELSGTGVAFKLVSAILQKKNFGLSVGQEKWFLDLVAIATIADMVPLIGENRVLSYYGLTVLNKTRRPGLQKLFETCRIRLGEISEDDIAFSISPRINAASRMGHPDDAFKIISACEGEDCRESVKYLEKINDERKGYVAHIVKEAKKMAKILVDSGSPLIVCGSKTWKPGVLGLAAQNLVREFNLPVFLWGKENGNSIKGSCRSSENVNVFELMSLLPKDTFINFGGHKYSGGFALEEDKILQFRELLENASANLSEKEEILAETIDMKLNPSDITVQFLQKISEMAPFGVGNKKPLFLIEKAKIFSRRNFGKEGNHLELQIDDGNKFLKAIKFFADEIKNNDLHKSETLNLVGNIERDNFGWKRELRMKIVDLI